MGLIDDGISLISRLAAPRSPIPEPGSVRLNGSKDAIIVRRLSIDSLLQGGPLDVSTLRQFVPTVYPSPVAKLTDVELLVNPLKADFAMPRDVQKIPTSAKRRYATQDYGVGLTTIRLECQTGNLIPYQSKELPTGDFTPIQPNGYPQVDTFDTRRILSPGGGGGGWTNLVLQGDRWRNFLSLLVTYREFDADVEIMLLTFGRAILRGHMENFGFSLEAGQAWNVRYGFDFVVLAGMETFTRGIESDSEASSVRNYLHAQKAADDVDVPGDFAQRVANSSPIIPFRSTFSVDPNGGQSVLDSGTTRFTDPNAGVLPTVG